MSSTLGQSIAQWMASPAGGWRCCKCSAAIDHPGACDACGEAWERSRVEQTRSGARATIPSHFRWATFESAELGQRCGADGPRMARAALDALRCGVSESVVFMGPARAGKTSLACAVLRCAIDTLPHLGYSARFVSASLLGRSRRDGRMGETPILVSQAVQSSFLLLDDVGQEVESDVIREVIQARHDADRPMLVTTFFGESAIAQRYGGGIAGRLFERSAVVDVTGLL